MKIMMIPTHHQTYNINTHQPPQQHQYLPPPGTLYTSPRAPQSIQLPPIQSFTKSQAISSIGTRPPLLQISIDTGQIQQGYIQYTLSFTRKLPKNTGQFQLNQQFINSPHFWQSLSETYQTLHFLPRLHNF